MTRIPLICRLPTIAHPLKPYQSALWFRSESVGIELSVFDFTGFTPENCAVLHTCTNRYAVWAPQTHHPLFNKVGRVVMKRVCAILGLASSFLAASAGAHTDDIVEEVVVFGRADQQIGTAGAASDGRVAFDDLRIKPIQRVGELVEVVPGMVATQHSGAGKANQYFLRDFNLDHGTDFSASIDGVPLNMRTHGHGQGYLDLNFLIPEMVESVEYKKGPYHASVGDFSSAGSVEFKFYDRIPEKMLKASVGEYHYNHVLAAGSQEFSDAGVLTLAAEITLNDGPWDLDEDLNQRKLYGAYSWQRGDLSYSIKAHHYDNDWTATDQVPLRAVRSGLIDELGFIDPDLGGETRRNSVTFNAENGIWHMGLYAVDYDFNLFSNFSYLLNDPLVGDEFEQEDNRTIYGGHFNGVFDISDGPRAAALRWGTSVRYDKIDQLGLYQTQARQRAQEIRSDQVDTWSLDGYVDAEVFVTEQLRLIGGARFDWLHWDVDAGLSVNSGSDDDFQASPKFALAYRVNDHLELYANWGRGFHSNDVRGATITVDPLSGAPVDPVDVFARSTGYEAGMIFEQGRNFNIHLVAFDLELDSELLFVGDAGTTEASGRSERQGVEVAAFWQLSEGVAVNLDYTWTDAKFSDGDEEIPGAVGKTASAGLIFNQGPFNLSLTGRYLGSAPLIEDDSVRSESSIVIHGSIGYRAGPVELSLEVFNLTDSNDFDIAYFYESRLPGEAAAGVEDIHFHPLEPRTARFTATYFW